MCVPVAQSTASPGRPALARKRRASMAAAARTRADGASSAKRAAEADADDGLPFSGFSAAVRRPSRARPRVWRWTSHAAKTNEDTGLSFVSCTCREVGRLALAFWL